MAGGSMNWSDAIAYLSPTARVSLSALHSRLIAKGTVMFRAGDAANGFVIVVSGRIDVFLTGPTGREILLYSVEPGQSCVQTTLGLMGDEPYGGEGITATDAQVVLIPKPLFLHLMDQDAAFRRFVLQAFARRMHDMTRLLERVAFGKIDSRLAAALLDLNKEGRVVATQADLAVRIGSAREVVTRQLDAFARQGWVRTERGEVDLCDVEALRHLASALV